jgi:hypothetical protein
MYLFGGTLVRDKQESRLIARAALPRAPGAARGGDAIFS